MAFGSDNKGGPAVGGNAYWLLQNTLGELIIDDGWTPSLQAEETADDSDKSITVSADVKWKIQSIWIELTTTANAGNRQIEIQIQDDAADVIARIVAGVTQAASLTYHYLFSPEVEDLTALRDTTLLYNKIPGFVLPEGYIVRVFDNNAVDAAADDMIVQMLVLEKAVP